MGLQIQCTAALLIISFAYCGTTVSAARSVGGTQSSLLAKTQAGTAPVATGLQDPKVPINGVTPTGHVMSGQGLWASTTYSYPSQMGGFKASSRGTWGQVYIPHTDLHLYMKHLTFTTRLVNSHVCTPHVRTRYCGDVRNEPTNKFDNLLSFLQAMYYSGASSSPNVGEVSGVNAGISIGSNFIQQKYVWMLDTANGLVYQVGSADGVNSNGVVTGVFLSQPSCAIAETYLFASTFRMR